MTDNKINPEDYYEWEDENLRQKVGGGGGSGNGKKGKKTLKAIRKEQVNKFDNDRKGQLKKSIILVVSEFPKLKTSQEAESYMKQYIEWINSSLNKEELDLSSETEFETSRSSGPGGQNVNKRSTKVSLKHTPTNIRSESSSNRNQLRNREEAERLLEEKVSKHIDDWKEYLNGKKLSAEILVSVASL